MKRKITARQEAGARELDVSTSSRAKRTREYLTADEIDKLLTAAKTASRNPARDYCALLLMFRHGLRVSELCAIKLSDINVGTKEFHVNRLKGCDSGPHEFYNGESKAVKAWLIERAKMNPPADVDTLFISERRKPLSRVTVWYMIGEISQGGRPGALGYPPAYAAAFDRVRVSEQGHRHPDHPGYLGHRSISSTVRYTKLDSRRFAKLF